MKTAIPFSTLALLLLAGARADDKPQPKETPAETTAEEIAVDFAKFPTEAPKEYTDKQLRITGEVEKVDGKNVYLKHDRAVGAVFIILQTPDAPDVEAGDQVQAAGSMAAVAGGSVWFKCKELKCRQTLLETWQFLGVRGRVPEEEPDWRFEEGRIVFLDFVAVASTKDLKRGATATYKVDPTQKPSTIDLKLEDGKEVRGIYLLANDALVVCLSKAGEVQTDRVRLQGGGRSRASAAPARTPEGSVADC